MVVQTLLKSLTNQPQFEIRPFGKTGFYVEGKKLTKKDGVRDLFELLEDEFDEKTRADITGKAYRATPVDGEDLIAGIRRLYDKRVKEGANEYIGKLDVTKSFKHTGLAPIRDIETGQRGLFDTAKDRVSPLDWETWYDKIPGDKEQREAIMGMELLGLMQYDPYTLQAKKIRTYEGQEIYQFNSHIPPAWRFTDTEVEVPEFFLDFMEHLLPDKKCRIYTINWMHEMIFGRNETMLVMVSTKGTGKNIFMEICEKLVGEHNYQIHSEDLFRSQFMGELENKRLVAFDETPISLKYKDKLKRISNARFSIERKGKEVELGKENFASYIIANNVHDGNHIDSDDRRFSVLDITEKRLQERFSDNEIDTFVQALRNNPAIIDGIGQYIVANYDDSFENHIPYKGVKFYELRYWSLPQWKRFIVDLVQSERESYYPIDSVRMEYDEVHNARIWPTNNTIQKFLDEWRDYDGDKIANIDKIEGDYCLNPTAKYMKEEDYDI
jgi:hypothetical protein